MSIFQKIYGLIAFCTIFLGFIVSILYLFSIIVGGSLGESIALFGGSLMTWCIKLASIAALFGIIHIYIKKDHSLTMSSDSKKENQELPM
ncbi:cellulose synthase/poly-beta-1,6-N-acetylglucosamine synthase-like glycosyltransferase [Cytobacillus horneckiae]|uniref:hypothetical protein n=1 Tax=Cytobacillus horneckiae TaxID=549687 RepID=UPI0019D19016|nr:hypothetical protein [Cytobacillus horneckiae]MBN6885100.1 hypothetical protein [Cytobacillus horneckiae]